MEKALIKSLEQEEWYQQLVEECRAIVTEAVFTSRWALVEGYWNLGERITKDNNFDDRKEIYGKKILQGLAKSIGLSERTLYYALQAYDKYPDIQQIPEGKNISWNKLITKYLPLSKKTETYTPELYNIWNFAKRNVSFGQKYFGNQTADLIINLLYYFTKEKDLVWDVFAGSGLTQEACKYMGRECYSTDIRPTKDFIDKMDVTQELPDIKPQFIFLDPPYWKQAEGKYSNEATDFSNMNLKDFYTHINDLFKRISGKYEKPVIALIIQNTQWLNNLNVEPHGLKLYGIMNKYFNFIHHIIVPYSTEQYNAQQVLMAKDKKVILQSHRDLLIFEKE